LNVNLLITSRDSVPGLERPSLVEFDLGSVRERDSLDVPTTVGGMAAQIDRNKIDKEIKTEVVNTDTFDTSLSGLE